MLAGDRQQIPGKCHLQTPRWEQCLVEDLPSTGVTQQGDTQARRRMTQSCLRLSLAWLSEL